MSGISFHDSRVTKESGVISYACEDIHERKHYTGPAAYTCAQRMYMFCLRGLWCRCENKNPLLFLFSPDTCFRDFAFKYFITFLLSHYFCYICLQISILIQNKSSYLKTMTIYLIIIT